MKKNPEYEGSRASRLEKARDYYRRDFINFLSVERNLSPRTLKEYAGDLAVFIDYFRPYLEEELTLASMDERTIREFMTYLKMELHYTARSVNRKLATLKAYFHFLKREGHIEKSPVEDIRGAKLEKHLPKVLDEEDVVKLLETAERVSEEKSLSDEEDKGSYKHFIYYRNYAIMELFYASGMRISELANMDLEDIDFKNNMVKVTGKGNKQRLVLMNDVAAQALAHYLAFRPEVPISAVFLNRDCGRLSVRAIQKMFHGNMLQSGIRKQASPHTMRHSFATHLLKGGSDLVTIKELLGHENLSTTQIYTNITMQHIKKTYDESHPRTARPEKEE